MTENVVVVTGASRGLGRGIARAFGSKSFKVYVTGRNIAELENCAAEIVGNGGQAVVAPCDHAVDSQVQVLFEKIERESGRLDILVNNATAVNLMALPAPGGFWEKPLDLADMITVGLRSHYVAAYYATPLMIRTGGGLIANISFYGAVSYHFGAAYGAAKAGTDKMSFDMAADLRSHGLACVSIWPGFILTDMLKAVPQEYLPAETLAALPNFEMPEFTGLVIEQLWRDPKRMALSGESLIGAELGIRYGIKDLDGKQPPVYIDHLGKPGGRFILPHA
jgi:NAD(P)-dependent dehydrogenase (short-subunit alcohol dehydrogenase family)